MTPLEKLKALAAAKKAAAATQTTEEKQDAPATVEHMVSTPVEEPTSGLQQPAAEVSSDEGESSENADQGSAPASNESSRDNGEPNHPLVMQLAELEQALNENLPEFRTILRDIHSKLRQDPAIVTALSEDEIGAIVSGLIHHANIEIVAPKAVKAAKKAAKTPVSASDL